MLEQVLHEMAESLRPECILRMGVAPDWGMFPLTYIIKQKASSPVHLQSQRSVEGLERRERQILCALAFVECRPAKACERPPAMTTGTLDWRIFHLRDYLLPYSPTSTEITLVREGLKMILAPIMPVLSWVMSEKHSHGDGSVQKRALLK